MMAYSPPVQTYADTRPVHTVYLFRDHTITMPRGHVVMLCGMGGTGKGMVACDFAGRNSRGENASGEPGTTIMVTPEDDAQETVAWRLRAARAEMNRVIDMTVLEGGAPFRLDASRGSAGSNGTLRAQIDMLQQHDERLRADGVTDPGQFANPTLVIIEPLLATVTAGSIATDTGARHVIAPLQKLAAETGVTVLLTHHMTKGGKDVAGSRAIVNAPRLVYEVAKDPDYDGVALLTLRKSNIMGTTGGSRYAIVGDGNDAHVEWLTPDMLEIDSGSEEVVPGIADWRVRALRGPLAAIGGAELEPVSPFAAMPEDAMAGHLVEMHGLKAGLLSRLPWQALATIHGFRHDTGSLVPHRHGDVVTAQPLAITAGEPEPVPDEPQAPWSKPAPRAITRGKPRVRASWQGGALLAPGHEKPRSSRQPRPVRDTCKHPFRITGLCRNCPRRAQ